MEWNVGDVVTGKITGISKFGAFVELESGRTGLVHISEISSEYVENIADVYSVGDEVKAKVISVEKGKISLSVKQLDASVAPKKEPREKKVHTPRPKYQSPGRPGDAAWEVPENDMEMSFEDKLSKFKQASDEKLYDLKKKNGNDSKRRGKRGTVPII